MDTSTVISLIAMIFTILSTIVAIIQMKKGKEELNRVKSEINTMIKSSEKNKATITNKGKNKGVMAQEVHGGVNIGK